MHNHAPTVANLFVHTTHVDTAALTKIAKSEMIQHQGIAAGGDDVVVICAAMPMFLGNQSCVF